MGKKLINCMIVDRPPLQIPDIFLDNLIIFYNHINSRDRTPMPDKPVPRPPPASVKEKSVRYDSFRYF